MQLADERTPASHLTWARSKSTTKPVEPKKLSADEAAAMASQNAGAGSTWNSSQTWEEKEISKWSKELLREELLPSLTLSLPSEGAALPALPASQEALAAAAAAGSLSAELRVTAVEKVDGEATHIISRGKQRLVFEFTLKLQLQMELREGEQLREILSGTLTVAEVTNDELQQPKFPSKCTCEQREWSAFFEPAAKQCWLPLRALLEAYVEQAKTKWRN